MKKGTEREEKIFKRGVRLDIYESIKIGQRKERAENINKSDKQRAEKAQLLQLLLQWKSGEQLNVDFKRYIEIIKKQRTNTQAFRNCLEEHID